jgi:DNA modification methylase
VSEAFAEALLERCVRLIKPEGNFYFNVPNTMVAKIIGCLKKLQSTYVGPINVLGQDGKGWKRVPGQPNQLPEPYLEWLIRQFSKPGDLVLDPFLGSGTTSVVARALKRRSVGIEINPELAKAAYERIRSVAVRGKP